MAEIYSENTKVHIPMSDKDSKEGCKKSGTCTCDQHGVTFTHVLCVFTCVCCVVSCVYMTVVMNSTLQLRNDCCAKVSSIKRDSRPHQETSVGFSGENDPTQTIAKVKELVAFLPNERHIRQATSPSPKDKRRRKNCKKFPEKCENRKKTKGKSRKKTTETFVTAAHYIPMMEELKSVPMPQYDPFRMTDCAHVPKLKGYLCRKNRFRTNSTDGHLHVFKEADWVTNISSPFKLHHHGNFEAKQAGIYLVYSQVLFFDNGDKGVVALVQERHGQEVQRLGCYQSLGNTSQMKTCSIIGLFKMEIRDTLVVQNVYTDIHVHLTPAVSYFGAVMLGKLKT